MPRIRPRELTLVVLAGAALIGLVALTAAAGTGNEASATGSSFSNRPDGARAAYLTLRQLEYHVERSHEPVAALTVDPAATVLVLASPQVGLSNQDRRALTSFVERGGVALVTGFGGALALGADAAPVETWRQAVERQTYQALEPSDLTAGAKTITMDIEASSVSLGSAYVPVYGASGQDVVFAARLGEGRVIWWAGATPLTNDAIAEAGNFELLLNVLGDGERAVLWDEHYHGYARSLWSYAAATPLPWAGMQIAMLALAAALTWSRRAGPLRPRAHETRTSPMEFVETMGGLYERAGVAGAAVAAAARRLRRTLAVSSGLSTDATDDQLAAAGAARLRHSPEALVALLREADDAAAGAPDAAAARDLVARLQAATARARASGRATFGERRSRTREG